MAKQFITKEKMWLFAAFVAFIIALMKLFGLI